MLRPDYQDHVLPVVLKKPDQHGPFPVALNVGDRLPDVEWRADPADADRISNPGSEAFYLGLLLSAQTVNDMGSVRDVLPRPVVHSVAVPASRRMLPISAAAARRAA